MKALLLIFALWLAPLAGQDRAAAPPLDTSSLTAREQRVLEHLRLDWRKQFRTTSIPVAAEALGVPLSDDSRLRLAQFVEAHRHSFTAPSRHGATTIALTPEEKLAARAVLLREIRGDAPGTARDLAPELNVPLDTLRPRFEFLTRFGAASAEGRGENRRYRAAERYPRRPSPRIDFYSHLVEVNGRERFEVA